jgi:DNA-binding MarR family transcriptional regulator
MPASHLLLENQVCFRVYSLERRISAAYRPLLAGLGLTYPQYLVMLFLWEHGEGTVGAICQALGLDTGTVSPLLKRLEARGHISRERSPGDERSVVARLTKEGKALAGKAKAVPGRMASCLFEDEAHYLALKKELDRALARMGEGAV